MSDFLAKHNNCMPVYCRSTAITEADLSSLNFGVMNLKITNEIPSEGFYFVFTPETCDLRLQRAGTKDKGLVVDFEKDLEEYKAKKLSPHTDLLARAINVADHPKICDLTMGLAQDSSKLVFFGGTVMAVERNPIVAALVKNALERAVAVDKLKSFHIHFGEMKEFLDLPTSNIFDAYYLDPMFSHKRTALPKKEMQYLADLVENASDDDYKPIIEKIKKFGKRLVIKRPKQAGPLCGQEPRHSIEGKMIRFDVY